MHFIRRVRGNAASGARGGAAEAEGELGSGGREEDGRGEGGRALEDAGWWRERTGRLAVGGWRGGRDTPGLACGRSQMARLAK